MAHRALLPAVLALLLTACGGGGGGGGTPSPSPSPSPGPQNPCTTAQVEALDAALETSRLADGPAKDPAPIDDSTRWRVLEDLWTHRAAMARVAPQALSTPAPTRSADIGDIAVLHDQGDLILPANTFDLRGVGLRFTRNDAGGFDARRIDVAFRATLGTRLQLQDDDSRPAGVPFTFSFYGRGHTGAFVNSDGNITFDEEDRASTERNVSRLLTGPPRVAPLLSDLDPSAGGSVWLHSAADQFTVTWCNVPEFDSARRATVQVSLLPDGAVEMKIDSTTTLTDAVVGLSPGRTGEFRPVDLSAQGPTPGGDAAVGERFSQQGQLDTVAVGQRFYQTHPDAYDQLVIWTDTRVLTTAFAYESTVANEIRGIGQDVYDISREWGSSGRLRSVVVMDSLTKYPEDPAARLLRQETTLSLLGHESGHRWLALLEFRDHNGQRSKRLLGRDEVHWSFFFDSDASFLEGNDIEDRTGGSFRTVGVVSRYSLLDQYAMGLVRESQVPEFFYVDAPTNTTHQPADPPQLNQEFAGTRRDVLIQDIVAIHGPRTPSVDASPKVHRQAFIYVTRAATPDQTQVAKLDRIRREWEPFFRRATDERMRVETRLGQ